MRLFALYFSFLCLAPYSCIAQKATVKESVDKLLSDPNMKYAQFGFGVKNLTTGKIEIDYNTKTGLVPASTLKVMTSISAFEILGSDYKFPTKFYLCKNEKDDNLRLEIETSGDPTFGSDNFEETKANVIFRKLESTLPSIPTKNLSISITYTPYSSQSMPDHWSFVDIGNYYGAGSYDFNWKENYHTIRLKSGNKIGDTVEVLSSFYPFANELTSEKVGSGDNCYVYPSLNKKKIYLRGSIPINEDDFPVKATVFNPKEYFLDNISSYFLDKSKAFALVETLDENSCNKNDRELLYTHFSPKLELLINKFHEKSINLYGEALLKRIAYEKTDFGDTKKGINYIKAFWDKRGIDSDALNIKDASGLSSANRITVEAQLQMLEYAQKQSWKELYMKTLPLVKGIRMKSGTISGVKGYTGYIQNKKGETLAFSILVNNHIGSSSYISNKLVSILENLKELD